MIQPIEITPALLKAHPLPGDGAHGDKDAHGRILVIGGSPELAGAAVLAGTAALRAGAGKLRYAAPAAYAAGLGFQMPEARVIRVAATEAGEVAVEAAEALKDTLGQVEAVVAGPGMLDEDNAGALAAALLRASPTAFVIDAAAMTGLRHVAGAADLCRGRAILTPHHGEMAKLMGAAKDEVSADPAAFARRAAERFQAVVALKDRQTHIAAPDGAVWRNASGVGGLGVCGSGDVLAGVIGGLLARGASPAAAAIWGVYLHAQAGRSLVGHVGPRGFLAREIAGRIPAELLAAQSA